MSSFFVLKSAIKLLPRWKMTFAALVQLFNAHLCLPTHFGAFNSHFSMCLLLKSVTSVLSQDFEQNEPICLQIFERFSNFSLQIFQAYEANNIFIHLLKNVSLKNITFHVSMSIIIWWSTSPFFCFLFDSPVFTAPTEAQNRKKGQNNTIQSQTKKMENIQRKRALSQARHHDTQTDVRVFKLDYVISTKVIINYQRLVKTQ